MTQITIPENGPVDPTVNGSEPREVEAGDIGSNDWKLLNDGTEDENPTNNLEQPLLLTTSTLLRPPMFFFHSPQIFRQRFKHY